VNKGDAGSWNPAYRENRGLGGALQARSPHRASADGGSLTWLGSSAPARDAQNPWFGNCPRVLAETFCPKFSRA
jgi:hypothetical protein